MGFPSLAISGLSTGGDLGIWISALYFSKHYLKALAPDPLVLILTSTVPGTPRALDVCLSVRNEGVDGVKISGQAGVSPYYLCSLSNKPTPGSQQTPRTWVLNEQLGEAGSRGTVSSVDR